jgi:hypothetical protein
MWISFDGGAHWQDFRNNLPTVAVYDIRFQPQTDDLLIATHGRGIYVMDDMSPVQRAGAQTAGATLFAPRTAYQYNFHNDDEGTYTDYTGNNPPYGAVVTYYQPAASKTPLKIEILDDSNHAIRTISGTHKVDGKDVPYVPNKAGLNQYVWDFNIDGPVKWSGAAKGFEGPNEGPSVPPGRYAVRMTLDGHTFTQRFDVQADPRTLYTMDELKQAYAFNLWLRQRFTNVDVMLNALDAADKDLQAASSDASVKGDAAAQQAIRDALAQRAAIIAGLTANYQSGEDSLQEPGQLREDIGPGWVGLVTPAVREWQKKIDARYRASVVAYNAFVASLDKTNVALRAAGAKPVNLPVRLSY